MNYAKIRNIQKLYFGYEELARALGISGPSARVTANRYVKQGIIVRVKRNIYVLGERWSAIDSAGKFVIASVAQTPSYISLMTAMEHYQVTTQMQRGFIESVALKRTKEVIVGEDTLRYSKIDKKLYFGFVRKDGYFIATPEKALLDAAYLTSLGRYDFDATSVDFNRFDRSAMRAMIGKFPKRTKELLLDHGYLKKA
jgi:predicted transcriptional regulator of viral defense system